MPRIVFIEHGGRRREVDVPVGHTLMEGARDSGVAGILADCGGACACSTCHAYIATDWVDRLGAPDEMEIDMLDFAHEVDPERSRLTCQIRATPEMEGMVVEVPERQP